MDNLVESRIDLAPRQAEEACAEVYVLASGELRVKPCTKLDQRHDATRHPDLATRRPGDARDQLQQRCLARAVGSDDAEARSGRHVEGHISQRKDRRTNPAPCSTVVVRL